MGHFGKLKVAQLRLLSNCSHNQKCYFSNTRLNRFVQVQVALLFNLGL